MKAAVTLGKLVGILNSFSNDGNNGSPLLAINKALHVLHCALRYERVIKLDTKINFNEKQLRKSEDQLSAKQIMSL